MSIDEQIAYFKSHAPRILAGLTLKQVNQETASGGHGEPINIAYEILPSGKGYEVLATRVVGPDGPGLFDPIYLRALEASDPKPLFVSWQHGYDGEFGHLGGPPDREESIRPYVQLMDGAALIVVFHYPDDLFEDRGEADPKPEDLFTWISFISRNSRGELTPLFDFECA